jgi:hypothetical protein
MGRPTKDIDIFPKFVNIHFIPKGEKGRPKNVEIPAFLPTNTEERLPPSRRYRRLDFPDLSPGETPSLTEERMRLWLKRERSA